MAVTQQTVELILVHAVRSYKVAAQMKKAGLTPEHFFYSPFSVYTPVWEAMLDFISACERAGGGPKQSPSYDIFITYLVPHLDQRNAEQNTIIGSLLGKAFNTPESELRPDIVLMDKGILWELVTSIRLVPYLRDVASNVDASDIVSQLDEVSKIRRETAMTSIVEEDITSPSRIMELTTEEDIVPTNVPFWDNAIKGMPRKCYAGVLAGTGGGKTTFAVQLVTTYAIHNRHVMFFSYEQNLKGDLVQRIYRRMAGVSREEAYGKSWVESEIGNKFNQVAPTVDKYIHIASMSGDREDQGTGGPDEIYNYVQDVIERGSYKPDLIVVDWLEVMLRRWTDAASTTGLRDYPKQLKYVVGRLNDIVNAFNVQLVLFQQLAAAKAESMKPNTITTHYNAAELKSFADLMQCCCTFGRIDSSSRNMIVNWSKCRWHDPVNVVANFDANHDSIHDASHMELNIDKFSENDGMPWFRKKSNR